MAQTLLSRAGNTNSIFALDYISGALTLNGLLDRENPLYSHGFILTVKVRLAGTTCLQNEGLPSPERSTLLPCASYAQAAREGTGS